MKKHFAIIVLFLSFVFTANAQTRGIKIGYIDMEYILQNVQDYAEAKDQLEQKAIKWKQSIEEKKITIAKLKDALKTERALLTKELIEEREEEIKFQEDELLEFQQKKFGPNGDLITQKAVLVKPIQDQVFTAVQDIAEAKKYDYIFDKSSDLTMLFAAKRHDVSDQVIRAISRAGKREQLSKKQLKEEEAKEYEENLEDINPSLAARRKVLEEKKLAREKLAEERKAMIEQKKLEQQEKRDALLAGKEAQKVNPNTKQKPEEKTPETDKAKTEGNAETDKKTGTVPANEKTAATKTDTTETKAAAPKKTKEEIAAEREKALEERKKLIEEKKQKILEERQRLLDEREAAKKAKEQEQNDKKTEQKQQ